jgi:hypothetical protein
MPTQKKSDQTESDSTEVAPSIDWGKISSPQDARIALENAGVPVFNSNQILGDGADFIKDKNVLVGVPFLVLDWHFIVDDKTQREYANVLVMNGQGDKARFNDGSTGVYAQLKKVTEEYGKVAISCKFGLRKSEYTTDDGSPATTYYLSA